MPDGRGTGKPPQYKSLSPTFDLPWCAWRDFNPPALLRRQPLYPSELQAPDLLFVHAEGHTLDT